MKRASPWFMISLLIIILLPGSAFGHKVSVFAWIKGKTVHAEGHLADGSPCGNCRVTVTDPGSGRQLMEGTASAEGTFSFVLPDSAGMKIVFNAGRGHAGAFILEQNEGRGTSYDGKSAHTRAAHGNEREGTLLATADMEALLDEKLGPIHGELRRFREAAERPGATEVLGGIGYIIGLLGFATYIKYRKGK